MQVPFPRFPAEFEIPDDWWVEAGMSEFVRHTPAYRSTTADLVALNDISGQPFKYRVLAGVHRFYASMAAGFEFLPSTTRGVCS